MAEPFLAQVMIFAGTFAPKGWAFCDGSLLPVAQNSALFSLLGTTFGGDGRSTFALPDLRGRVAVGAGNGPGLSPYTAGESGGVETVTLAIGQIPSHTHTVAVAAANEATTPSNRPGGNILGAATIYNPANTADTALGGVTCANAGSNQAHENRQPFLAVNYIIALQGIYPSRP